VAIPPWARCLKNGRRYDRPFAISTAQALSKLIEVSFGPGRRAVPPPPWPDAPRLAEGPDVRKLPEAAPAAPQQAEGPDVRKLPEAAPAAPQQAEGLDGRKPPEAAPAAELLVSQRRPAVG